LLTVDDFDFTLPEALIAQHPARERSASRLLTLTESGFTDQIFSALPALLNPGDLLVFNEARVIKARFFGQKESGGRVEVMLERIEDARHALAQVCASKSPKPGSRLRLAEAFEVTVIGREESFFRLELAAAETENFWELAERHGSLPLPPYITHLPEADDEARYQTIYARNPGAVAAPTAGLHFDAALLHRLAERGIEHARLTLHVGAGTYQPVRVHAIAEHQMHKERFELPETVVEAVQAARARGGRIIAVGTTSLRTLESAADAAGNLRAGSGETGIFITPGYRFRVVQGLLTNFHLPRSTLLMLVSAFAGMETIRKAYAHAIRERYRFFSYGDAMLLWRTAQERPIIPADECR
jgi:S-adenosylmethionine:tRNA ribosyltransferase-isomerase